MKRITKPRRQRARILVPRRSKIAASPGTIEPPSDSPKPELRAIFYGPDVLEEHIISSPSELAALRKGAPFVWLNIDGIGDAEVIKSVGEHFGLHSLALEDAVNMHQRPKSEDYEDHAYVVLQIPLEGERLRLEQLSLFVGKDYLLTVQPQSCERLAPVLQRLRAGRGRIRRAGADYLAYAVIDAVIDNYFPLIDTLNLRLDLLEEQIVRHPSEDAVAEVHAIRHDLHALRRVLAPTREAIGALTRSETTPLSHATRMFMRDCQDHTAQLLDAIEACRELSTGLIDLNHSGLSNRMNEVMKMLTLISTIFIPLSFLAGLYGMNFDRTKSVWNMPELGWAWGYPFALGLMFVTAIGFIFYFRRRGWIGRS